MLKYPSSFWSLEGRFVLVPSGVLLRDFTILERMIALFIVNRDPHLLQKSV
jgi:hypothetical protein